MKIREAIERVQSLYNAGVGNDDIRLRNRRVWSKLKTARAEVLAEEKRTRRKIGDQNYTFLPCVPFEKVSAHECACAPIEGCTFMKSKCALPSIKVDSITSIDGKGVQFTVTDWKKIKHISSERYTSKSPRAFFKNDFLYLIGPENYPEVAMKAVFEDPVEALNCRACGLEECIFPLDKDFDLDLTLYDRVFKKTVFELMGINRQHDGKNDGREQAVQTSEKR